MTNAAPVRHSEEDKLRNALTDMDAMSQEITSNIESLCDVTLMAMKTAEFWKYPQHLVQILTLISARAQDLGNCINGTAENYGCNWIDQSQRDDETCMRDAILANRKEACNG